MSNSTKKRLFEIDQKTAKFSSKKRASHTNFFIRVDEAAAEGEHAYLDWTNLHTPKETIEF